MCGRVAVVDILLREGADPCLRDTKVQLDWRLSASEGG